MAVRTMSGAVLPRTIRSLLTILLSSVAPLNAAPQSAVSKAPLTLGDIANRQWLHIGAPPEPGSAGQRAAQWRSESVMLNAALSALKQAWPERSAETLGELRSKVLQFEDVARAVTDAGGYGNLILAETARRLSITAMCRYAIAHPPEHTQVRELLAENRVRLLDSPAMSDMLLGELNVSPPLGGWRLSERWDGIKLVVAAEGTSLRDLGWERMLQTPSLPSLTTKRSVTGLLARMINDEGNEQMMLPALLEFLKRGGDIKGIRSYNRVMGQDAEKFRYVPWGNSEFADEQLIEAFVKNYSTDKGPSFEDLVGQLPNSQ